MGYGLFNEGGEVMGQRWAVDVFAAVFVILVQLDEEFAGHQVDRIAVFVTRRSLVFDEQGDDLWLIDAIHDHDRRVCEGVDIRPGFCIGWLLEGEGGRKLPGMRDDVQEAALALGEVVYRRDQEEGEEGGSHSREVIKKDVVAGFS